MMTHGELTSLILTFTSATRSGVHCSLLLVYTHNRGAYINEGRK
jgi:hypothetical protein